MSRYQATNDPNAEDADEMSTCVDCGREFYVEDLCPLEGICTDCEEDREEDAREVDEDGE